MTRVLLNKNMRDHPLVGFGLGMRRRANRGLPAYTKGDAWIYMNMHEAIVHVIPGIAGNPQSLDIAQDGYLPNVANAWNWTVSDTRRWLSRLSVDGLITEQLASVLFARLPSIREPRQHIPKSTRAAVLAKTSGRCVYCGTSLVLVDGQPNSYRPDHVLPVARGGGDDVANLIPSCRSCNGKKGAKTIANIWMNTDDGRNQ